jgi:hypothetical protein
MMRKNKRTDSLFVLTRRELDWLMQEVQSRLSELDSMYGLSPEEWKMEEHRLLKSGMALLRKRRAESRVGVVSLEAIRRGG